MGREGFGNPYVLTVKLGKKALPQNMGWVQISENSHYIQGNFEMFLLFKGQSLQIRFNIFTMAQAGFSSPCVLLPGKLKLKGPV